MFNDVVDSTIHQHAIAEYPNEACGVVVDQAGTLAYIPVKNIAPTSMQSDYFVFDPVGLADAEDSGVVIAYVHSHPDATIAPSEADKTCCKAHGLPWIIVDAGRHVSGQVVSCRMYELLPETHHG